jgi:hypothetical protein
MDCMKNVVGGALGVKSLNVRATTMYTSKAQAIYVGLVMKIAL